MDQVIDQFVYFQTIKNFSKRVYDQTTSQFGLRCCHFTDIFLYLLTDISLSLSAENISKRKVF